MAFELKKLTEVEFFHVNVRPEFHGEESARAADIGIRVKGENTLLDLVKPGLREHHFCDRSTAPGQVPLPLTSLPNIRHPELATKYAFAKGERWKGYSFNAPVASLAFEDCAIAAMQYEFYEGGSCVIQFLLQYNGDDLADDGIYGRTAGLATMGKGKVRITAGQVQPITEKGFHSGHSTGEAPAPGGQAGAGAEFQTDLAADTESDVVHAEGSPEAALAGAVAQAEHPEGWPFPNSAHQERKGRARRAPRGATA